MSQKSVTLALKLTDEKTKKVHAVLEKSIGLTNNEEVEENAKPFSHYVKGLISEVNMICEEQGLQISDVESIEQNMLVTILLSLAKKELKDISIDIPVIEVKKPEETREEEK